VIEFSKISHQKAQTSNFQAETIQTDGIVCSFTEVGFKEISSLVSQK
jgi:hypothetical protein